MKLTCRVYGVGGWCLEGKNMSQILSKKSIPLSEAMPWVQCYKSASVTSQLFLTKMSLNRTTPNKLGANPTIVSYIAIEKISNATSSLLVRFEIKKYFLLLRKTL
jgi:hypothetical protein